MKTTNMGSLNEQSYFAWMMFMHTLILGDSDALYNFYCLVLVLS